MSMDGCYFLLGTTLPIAIIRQNGEFVIELDWPLVVFTQEWIGHNLSTNLVNSCTHDLSVSD